MIDKAENFRADKNQSLPVMYKNQTHSWVTQEVFHKNSVPSVNKFLKKAKRTT